jgi:hypothetical protein
MGLEPLLDRQQRNESPAVAARVTPFTADVRDLVARAEPRREIPSSAQSGYRRHVGLEIWFATARAVNEGRKPVNANRLTACGTLGKWPIAAQVA